MAKNITIFVGNLSLEVSEEELRQEFVAFGQVTSVHIIDDNNGGQSRWFGFVEMPSKSEGEAAINSLNGKKLNGQTLDVIEALPLSHSKGSGSYGNRRFSGRL